MSYCYSICLSYRLLLAHVFSFFFPIFLFVRLSVCLVIPVEEGLIFNLLICHRKVRATEFRLFNHTFLPGADLAQMSLSLTVCA